MLVLLYFTLFCFIEFCLFCSWFFFFFLCVCGFCFFLEGGGFGGFFGCCCCCCCCCCCWGGCCLFAFGFGFWLFFFFFFWATTNGTCISLSLDKSSSGLLFYFLSFSDVSFFLSFFLSFCIFFLSSLASFFSTVKCCTVCVFSECVQGKTWKTSLPNFTAEPVSFSL